MSAQPDWGTTLIADAKAVIDIVGRMRKQVDMLAKDSTLPTAYSTNAGARADLAGSPGAQKLTDAINAMQQLVFAFDSGSPTTQSAAIYKII